MSDYEPSRHARKTFIRHAQTVAEEWDKLPLDLRMRLMREHTRLYFACSRINAASIVDRSERRR